MEHWKPVVGFEGWYEVSSLGRIRRLVQGPHTRPGYIHKKTLDKAGYTICGLSKYPVKGKQFRVARLVAQAFLGVQPTHIQVNHKNGIRNDDRVSNLEWVTAKENMHHMMYELKTLNPPKGENHWNTTLEKQDVIHIRMLAKKGESHARISKRYGITPASITGIVSRRTWKHI